MQSKVDFQNFLAERQLDLQPLIFATEGKECKWGRIVCIWHEQQTNLQHIYTPIINLENGDMYGDFSKKMIYVKFIIHGVYRPVRLFFKTIYHASVFISIPHIVYNSIQKGKEDKLTKKQTATLCLKNSFRSFADIVRTPAYAVAFITVNIAALIIGPFAPKHLYTFQESTGKLIRSFYSNKEDSYNDLFGCFNPIRNLQNINEKVEFKEGTIYPTHTIQGENKASRYEAGLVNLARSLVLHMRENHLCLVNPLRKLDSQVPYISPNYAGCNESNRYKFSSLPDQL